MAQKKTRLGALRKKKLTREKKIEKPSTKRFRVEFRSTNWRFDNPTWKLLLRYWILLAFLSNIHSFDKQISDFYIILI